MKKLLVAAAVSTTLLAPLAAQAQNIGVAMALQDTFLTILKNGTIDAANKAGAKVQVEDAQNDVGKQLSQIQNLIAQKVDAIIVNPVDTDATPKITKMVTAAKIPLVYVNRKPVDFATLPAGVAFVASDEKISGTVQTQEVCRLLKGKGDILVLMGELSNEAARTRTKDIEEVVATKDCSGMKIVDKREGKWDRTQGQDIMTNWLSSGVKFDAVIANNDEMAIGAINALKASKKWTANSIVAGIDATPDALASMKAGDLKVTVFQNAAGQGSGAVEAALKLIKKQPVERFVNVPFELVTPANLGKYTGKN
jgi:inositol transport system substrate-binding protein